MRCAEFWPTCICQARLVASGCPALRFVQNCLGLEVDSRHESLALKVFRDRLSSVRPCMRRLFESLIPCRNLIFVWNKMRESRSISFAEAKLPAALASNLCAPHRFRYLQAMWVSVNHRTNERLLEWKPWQSKGQGFKWI